MLVKATPTRHPVNYEAKADFSLSRHDTTRYHDVAVYQRDNVGYIYNGFAIIFSQVISLVSCLRCCNYSKL